MAKHATQQAGFLSDREGIDWDGPIADQRTRGVGCLLESARATRRRAGK